MGVFRALPGNCTSQFRLLSPFGCGTLPVWPGGNRMRIVGIVGFGAAAVLSMPPTHAAMANCSDATSTYNSAISIRVDDVMESPRRPEEDRRRRLAETPDRHVR